MKVLKWVEALLISIWAVFAPIHTILLVTLVLVMMDLVSGILAAKKRGEEITSSGLRRTLSKIFVYELTICVAYLGEHYMVDSVPIIKMASGMIGLVEVKSILENLDTINGSSLLKDLVTKLGSVNQ